MTIAAGFECSDGLVLATDLEITAGAFKRTGGKSTYNSKNGRAVAIAGSGYYDVLAYACEVLGSKKISDIGFQEIVGEIQRSVRQLYKEYIRPMYSTEELNEVLQLLVGVVQNVSGEVFSSGLYVSSRSILRKASPYEFVGIGRDLAFYLMQKRNLYQQAKMQNLLPMGLVAHLLLPSVEEVVPIAKEVLLEVQNNVPYCGHGVTVLKVTSDGKASYIDP
ncbi:MAG: hypothetical protein KGL39_47315 [Patescibacteria group bacterium]|nr:hypothetical protein [Patescibacteria group bacterium]